jgi:hypothetical protein
MASETNTVATRGGCVPNSEARSRMLRAGDLPRAHPSALRNGPVSVSGLSRTSSSGAGFHQARHRLDPRFRAEQDQYSQLSSDFGNLSETDNFPYTPRRVVTRAEIGGSSCLASAALTLPFGHRAKRVRGIAGRTDRTPGTSGSLEAVWLGGSSKSTASAI